MGLGCWRAEAPSNIALIKYMGKSSAHDNRPANSSLSLTLDHMVTIVEIFPSEIGRDEWEPLKSEALYSIALSETGKNKFLKHFEFLKMHWGISGYFILRSANNFPGDCGLASSASSFAALTKATFELAKDKSEDRGLIDAIEVKDLSRLSRQGSGSSCRSFFSPFALWKDEGAEQIQFAMKRLLHQAIILDSSKKEVSSSQAHARVVSSELFQGRSNRAEHRLQKLVEAFRQQEWMKSVDLVWQDFWDMHALFETSEIPFGYMNASSMKVLEMVREEWRRSGDGPMATMDAGANVHLIYRSDQTGLAKKFSAALNGLGKVIESPELSRARGYL